MPNESTATHSEVVKLAVGQLLVAVAWALALWLLANHWPHEGWAIMLLGPAVFCLGAVGVLTYRWWSERRRWQWMLPLGTLVFGMAVFVVTR